jgi:hypothetical protein
MRRFDKLKNIHKKNKSIEKEYLLETASLTSKSYRNRLLIESVMNSDDGEQLFNRFILEACEEHGMNIEEIITENDINISHKGNINESLLGLTAAGVLSGGKAMQLMGTAIRKMVNFLKRKGIIKGDKLVEPNKVEKLGKWLQEKIVMGFFRAAAAFLLVPIAGLVGAVSAFTSPDKMNKRVDKIAGDEAINTLASALFYAAVITLGVQGGIELWKLYTGGHGHGIFATTVELLTEGAKIYEVGLLLIATFLTNFVDAFKKYDITKLSHGIGECLENPGGVRKLVSSIKSVFSSEEKSANFSKCIAKKMEEH